MLVCGSLATVAAAQATIITYNDRIDWLAAVSGDVVTTEKFSTDAPDLTGGVDFSGFNLKSTGLFSDFPVVESGQLYGWVDFESNGEFLVTPVMPAHGFGGDFSMIDGEGIAAIVSYVGGGTDTVDLVETNGFSGFVSTLEISSFRLVGAHPDGIPASGEIFYGDNFHIAAPCAVPEPASMVVLGLGFLGLLKRRKKSLA